MRTTNESNGFAVAESAPVERQWAEPLRAVERADREGGDSGLRLCLVLTMLPRLPHKLTARVVSERLAERGFRVSVRTVERDLQKLRTAFPLAVDDSHKPFEWSWAENAPQFFPTPSTY